MSQWTPRPPRGVAVDPVSLAVVPKKTVGVQKEMNFLVVARKVFGVDLISPAIKILLELVKID